MTTKYITSNQNETTALHLILRKESLGYSSTYQNTVSVMNLWIESQVDFIDVCVSDDQGSLGYDVSVMYFVHRRVNNLD